MKSLDNDRFRNEPTRRFYNYFYEKLKSKEISADDFYDAFGADSYTNRSVFLSGLKQGLRSITIDHINIAHERFKLSPNYLFGLTDVATPDGDYVLPEITTRYAEDYRKEVGGKLRDIFEKHKTNISLYAQDRLGMTEQNLYKILRGQGRPYWDTIVSVCEDHGESLDLFRSKPLPKGHFLEQLASMKSENEALKNVNEILRGRVKELESSK